MKMGKHLFCSVKSDELWNCLPDKLNTSACQCFEISRISVEGNNAIIGSTVNTGRPVTSFDIMCELLLLLSGNVP